MSNTRKGVARTDVGDIAERVDEITDADNDNAVCAILRWAIRVKAGPTAALDQCNQLGLDLRAALIRARAANRRRT